MKTEITTMPDFLEQQLSDYEDLANDDLSFSTETYDEAHNFLIDEFGFHSKEVNGFYELGRNDEAVSYAIELGFDIED